MTKTMQNNTTNEFSYLLHDVETNQPWLEEYNDECETVRTWHCHSVTADDLQFLSSLADDPDVCEFLTAVDCWQTAFLCV